MIRGRLFDDMHQFVDSLFLYGRNRHDRNAEVFLELLDVDGSAVGS